MPDAPPALSALLREATGEHHRRAERSPFVRDLLAGRLERPAYVRLLRDLHTVYEGLEHGLDTAPVALLPAPLRDPALRRTPALAADLAVLHGPGWSGDLAPTEAAATYGRDLRSLALTRPVLLAAHAYVRYLGDLSGGRAMGRQVAKAYGLGPDEGLAFYAFPDISDVDVFKDRFRAALDEVGRHHDVEPLVDEGRRAFERNEAIFGALQKGRDAPAA